MAREQTEKISDIIRQRTPIDEAMNAAVRDAVLRHKQQCQPLAVWRDGKTVWVRAEDVHAGSSSQPEPNPER